MLYTVQCAHSHALNDVLPFKRFLHAIRAHIFLAFKRAIKRFHINRICIHTHAHGAVSALYHTSPICTNSHARSRAQT